MIYKVSLVDFQKVNGRGRSRLDLQLQFIVTRSLQQQMNDRSITDWWSIYNILKTELQHLDGRITSVQHIMEDLQKVNDRFTKGQ